MSSFKQVALICSAPINDYPLIRQRICNYSRIIAVDGGAEHCKAMEIVPDLIIGDLDSVSSSTLDCFQEIPIEKFPQDKDYTDLELALQTIDWNAINTVTVFGALEKRTDHSLTNLIILTRFPGKVFFETEQQRCFAIDQSIELQTTCGQNISLIPMNGPAKGVNSTGLKWELVQQTLDKHFISISNEAIAPTVRINVSEGDLLCFINI